MHKNFHDIHTEERVLSLRVFASKQLQSFHYSKKCVLKKLVSMLFSLYYSTFLLKDDVSARITTKGNKEGS